MKLGLFAAPHGLSGDAGIPPPPAGLASLSRSPRDGRGVSAALPLPLVSISNNTGLCAPRLVTSSVAVASA